MEVENKLKTLCELLSQKRDGSLDTEERINSDSELWRNCISYEKLESNVSHSNEEIRLNTLTLLVESKKSTLKFTKKELQIIIVFLYYNLKEKSEYIPLMKKAFKRMKESLAVMQRQLIQEEKARKFFNQNNGIPKETNKELEASLQVSENINAEIKIYNQFFIVIRDMCILALCPDATYYKRKSALQILCLMQNFFLAELKNIQWRVKDAEQVFTCLLLDTYEQNKTMAFKVLQSMDVFLMKLKDESYVNDLLTTALELGNSIRPIDSITASYTLKICLLSPVLQNVLKSKFDIHGCPHDLSEAATLQVVLLLIRKLQESANIAKENIVLAVTKYSLYGYIFCLRSLLDECNLGNLGKEILWRDTIANVIDVCFELDFAVSLIVNNSSPEGHLPMDFNTESTKNMFNRTHEDMPVTAQMVLLCSWRTVKEVSLLFGLLSTKAPIGNEDGSSELLTKHQVLKIGEHLVMLLSETKHRGAFEQAHVGFYQLCTRLWRLNDTELNELPKTWLHQILIAISGFAQENSKLCATRRSAGVPFMMQALLASEPRQRKDMKTSTFHWIMKILLGFTQFENNENLWEKVKQLLYQDTVFSDYEVLFDSFKCGSDETCANGKSVEFTQIKTHALNILRAIFRHSQLGELVNDYIADGLIASFKSYNGVTWAERNAATLLFSALIVRVFGVQRTKDHINLSTDNKMSGKVFFERYPKLQLFILDQLSKFTVKDLKTNTAMKSNAHPILLLLSRLYLNQKFDTADSYWMDIINFVSGCAVSPVYETRKLAARALVPLVTETISADTLKRLLNGVLNQESHGGSLNLAHGYLLQIEGLIEYYGAWKFKDIEWNKFLEDSKWILENLYDNNLKPGSYPLATVYIKIVQIISIEDHEGKLNLSDTLRTLVKHLTEQSALKYGPHRELYKTTALKFILLINKTSPDASKLLSDLCALHNIYFYALDTLDPDLQVIVWSTLKEMTKDTVENNSTPSLRKYSIDALMNLINDLHRMSPELQDIIYNYLYDTMINLETSATPNGQKDKIDIAIFIVNNIWKKYNTCNYYKRDTYIRLLAKAYVTLKTSCPDTLSEDFVADVYESLCDYSWIGSLNSDIRSSVFLLLLEIHLGRDKRRDFIDSREMQWWTTVLQLLVDDDFQVRQDAAELILKISGLKSLPCFTEIIKHFFNAFLSEMTTCPVVGCVLLFYWSMSLLGDSDYEMDETDVFNKCRNHEVYEPVEISQMCIRCANRLLVNVSDDTVPDHAIDWLNARLNTDFPKSISVVKLVKDYGITIPRLKDELRDILNPTYKEKLLQVLAYEKWPGTLSANKAFWDLRPVYTKLLTSMFNM